GRRKRFIGALSQQLKMVLVFAGLPRCKPRDPNGSIANLTIEKAWKKYRISRRARQNHVQRHLPLIVRVCERLTYHNLELGFFVLHNSTSEQRVTFDYIIATTRQAYKKQTKQNQSDKRSHERTVRILL